VVSVPAAKKARPAPACGVACDVASLLPPARELAAVLVRAGGGEAAGGGGGEREGYCSKRSEKHPYCGVHYDPSLHYAMLKHPPGSKTPWAAMWNFGVKSHASSGLKAVCLLCSTEMSTDH